MTKAIRNRILDVIDPGRKERGLVHFDRPGSIAVNPNKVVDRIQRKEQNSTPESNVSPSRVAQAS